MESRARILENIRKAEVPFKPLPTLSPGAVIEDLIAAFSEVLVSIGGRVFLVRDHDEIAHQVSTLFSNQQRILSVVPGLPWHAPKFSDDPHDLQDVDLAIIQGHLAVAENGAVWVTDLLMGDRSLPFIAQHLALVVPTKNVVATLSEAYDRIEGQSFEFGTFIAGPSKTADIEQSLVLGAHGPKSLTVYLVSQA